MRFITSRVLTVIVLFFAVLSGNLLILNTAIAQTTVSPNAVLDVAWNADGSKIAQVYSNGVIRVILANGGQEVFSFSSGIELSAAAVAWNPLNNNELAAGIERNIFIWNISTGQTIYTLLAGSPDGKAYTEAGTFYEVIESLDWNPYARLASVSLQGFIRVWDTTTGKTVFSTAYSESSNAAWSSDGTQLVIATHLSLLTVDVAASQRDFLDPDNEIEISAVSATSWSPIGNKIASGTVLGHVTIQDAVTGSRIHLLDAGTTRISELSWAPDSRLLATAGSDGALRIWDSVTGEQMAHIQHAGTLFTVAWSPDGSQLAYGGEGSNGAPIFEIIQVSAISIASTRGYVQRIYTFYTIYRALYGAG